MINEIMLNGSNFETAAVSVCGYLTGDKKKHVMVRGYNDCDHFYYVPQSLMVRDYYHNIHSMNSSDNGLIIFNLKEESQLKKLRERIIAVTKKAAFSASPEIRFIRDQYPKKIKDFKKDIHPETDEKKDYTELL